MTLNDVSHEGDVASDLPPPLGACEDAQLVRGLHGFRYRHCRRLHRLTAIGDVIALARESEDFAAHLRTMREWAILHMGLLEDLRVETEVLLADIGAELERLS